MNEDEHSIAVIPYLVYDALMERFERTQKNLRYSVVGSILLAVSLILSLVIGMGTTNGSSEHT